MCSEFLTTYHLDHVHSLEGLHLLHPILHRSKLLQELDLLYSGQEAGNGPFLFRINMVFAIGAVPLVRAGLHDVAPLRYYAAAMQTANEALGLAALEHAQSFLLILLFSLQHDIGSGFPGASSHNLN